MRQTLRRRSPATKSHTSSALSIRRHDDSLCGRPNNQQEGIMKLVLGKPDDTELVLAQQVDGAWRPNPNLATEMAAFLQGADPEQFEMWVEEAE
jgi:hypothetical protein